MLLMKEKYFDDDYHISLLSSIFISRKFLYIRNNLYLNVENIEESSSTDQSLVSEKTKKLFWVTRYSLGKTLSKELLIEHEFADDETRHRLIELHTSREDEKKNHLLLAIVALVLHPPIGLIACILAYMAKRQTKHSMNLENIAYERTAARYAFCSYIFSKDILLEISRVCLRSTFIRGLISIGLTIGMITAVLLYFFVRDLNMLNRNSLNINRYGAMPLLNDINPVNSEYLQQERTIFEDDGAEER